MSLLQRQGVRLCQKCWRLYAGGKKQHSVLSTISDSRGMTITISRANSLLKGQHPRKYPDLRYSSTSSEKYDDDVKVNMEDNPYFDKYKKKLLDLQRSSPKAYQEKIHHIEEEMRKDRAFIRDQLEKAEAEAKAKAEAEGKASSKGLDSIMKTDLIRDKTAEEIEEIWKEYHSRKECVFAVLKSIDYDDLLQKAKTCPSFLYPLPRQDGYEFFFSMISGKSVYFTPLIMYQQMKENAPPCLSLVHFTELQEDKGIVLMTGQYDDSLLKRKDAINLVRQMTMYYNRTSGERFNLVRIFNHMPNKFTHLDVINEYQEMVKYLESA
ncbi:ATP synthase mitochondrial F1 complex assembly factor 1-like [Haliotis rubra]|uniref:ATP synthase mitochondrial F1 complex assembly factor 1-like n=1 Tax=Haliotis rubra TaxID=36100 RepID=UPI001EE5ABEF|nr:ATP synthase mitochondrial F1 complex assembly factor 1-like [Haliotis rubra]XP_046546149.1 ATP synthase mitochondrial F1 complex assembly factor 1-like [Haliotis rubra]XP_046546209.1 ATP synthase mitochondrial F1 complex assembly factor 1-like [Haliotis rubra]